MPPHQTKRERKLSPDQSDATRLREFLDRVPRDELKESISLIEGHIPDAILKVERERCPRARSR
jgi:hypothetical protein